LEGSVKNWLSTLIIAGALVASPHVGAATPIELITNGDFETGTFLGWTVSDLAVGSGTWLIDVPGSTTPFSDLPTVGSAANESFYAVTDQSGPGTHVLSQTFVAPASSSVILAFDMFANDWNAGPLFSGNGLDHTGGANQFATVDILVDGASVFDTGAGVLANYYLGVDPGVDPNAFTSYLFDITSLVGGGGTFQLRFGETDNQSYFNMGVDNVSIAAEPAAVPEPATLLLFGAGLLPTVRRIAKRRYGLSASK
jgi:hypothetical protein